MSDEVKWIPCATARCGYSPFPVAASFDKRARDTGETFYCPAGHSLVYNNGKSKAEILAAENRRLKQRIANYEEFYDRASRESRQCPWPTCRVRVYSSRQGMFAHMVRIHNMPAIAEVEELAS